MNHIDFYFRHEPEDSQELSDWFMEHLRNDTGYFDGNMYPIVVNDIYSCWFRFTAEDPILLLCKLRWGELIEIFDADEVGLEFEGKWDVLK